MAKGVEEATLEYTPTWIVAVVCSIIVFISLAVERILHFLGKYFEKKHRALHDSLLRVKEELMIMGFISLLLTVFQGTIGRVCIPNNLNDKMLPCEKSKTLVENLHFQASYRSGVLGGARRILAGGSGSDYCTKKGKEPLLSITALHHLHIFIFVLAVTHVILSALTMVLAGQQIREWRVWEDEIATENYDPEKDSRLTDVHQHDFIRRNFQKDGKVIGWLVSFFKQFYSPLSKSDYSTLRLGFIMEHCQGNPKFNFHRYMVRVLEGDFKMVVGISWYLWIFVVIFLLLNVSGWNTYFWISFLPLILLLVVGTKLEHVMNQLASEVAERHTHYEGLLVIKPSDAHFWFNRPPLVLYLIHFILFQIAFEIAFFVWIWVEYGFDSCINGKLGYIITRLIIGVTVQVLCSYSTLPLYAIIAQMGSSFKKEVFDKQILDGLVGWAKDVRKKKRMRPSIHIPPQTVPDSSIEMQEQDTDEIVSREGTSSHQV